MERPVKSLNKIKKEIPVKKAFVIGMVLVSMSAAQVSFAAAANGAKAPRQMMETYVKQSREALFGKTGSAKNASEATLDTAKKALIRELDVPGLKGTRAMRSMMTSLSGEAGRARMEALVTIVAVKKMKQSLEATDPAEAKSIDDAANAAAKLLANAYLLGAKTDIVSLKGEELAIVKDSLTKLEKMPADIILQFEKAERDSFTVVIEKFNELVESSNGSKSYEELFVDAIMAAKGKTRAEALETAKKLKECV